MSMLQKGEHCSTCIMHLFYLQKIGKMLEVKLVSPKTRAIFDPAMLIIFTLAVSCVLVGGYWSGHTRFNRYMYL